MIQVNAGPGARAQAVRMEYHVSFDAAPDLDLIAGLLLDSDPAAVADVDPHAAPVLRVSTWLPREDLCAVLRQAGYRLPDERIRQLPSVCCGSCSG